MGLINQKTIVELPNEWNKVVQNARVNPDPFEVIPCDNQVIFKSWTCFLSPLYLNKCPFATRPVREFTIVDNHPRMMIHRNKYFGPRTETVVTSPKRRIPTLPSGQFKLPPMISISKAKYEDLQHLKKFCSKKAQDFFDSLPYDI